MKDGRRICWAGRPGEYARRTQQEHAQSSTQRHLFSTLPLKIEELNGQAAARIGPDNTLLASGLIDSMMVLDLIAFVEAQWLIAV
ncbi:MAG: hypothetical protein ABI212_00310, partial [Burkholderiaceae bacterium]